MATTLGISELLVFDPLRSRAAAHVFVSHPSPIEERALGRILLVAEITTRDRVNLDLLKDIQEVTKESYYRSERETVEAALEETLAAVNGQIATLTGDFGSQWLERLNLVVAAVRGSEVNFATVGSPSIILLHRDRIVDLLTTLSAPPAAAQPVNPLKAFTTIYTGRLVEGDHLLLLTSAFFDYVSQEKVKRLFLGSTSEHAMRTLERLLAENENAAAFAALSVDLLPASETAPEAPGSFPATRAPRAGLTSIPSAPQSSMDTLIAKEAATNEILQQSFWRTTKRSARQLIQRGRVWFRALVLRKPTRISPALERMRSEAEPLAARRPAVADLSRDLRNRLLRRERTSNLPASIGQASRAAILASLHGIRRLLALLRRRPGFRTELRDLPERPRSFLNRMVITAKRLPRARQVLLLIILAIALVTSFGLAQTSRSRNLALTTSKRSEAVSSIEDKVASAQASLLYGDESGARKLLAEASVLLVGFKEAARGDRDEQSRLEQLIVTEREKLQHRVTISSPTVLADLNAQAAGGSFSDLSLAGNTLLAIHPAKNTVARIDLSSKEISASPPASIIGHFQYATVSGRSLLILTTDNTILEVSGVSFATQPRPITVTADMNIAAIATYEGRLYLLDVGKGQIWRTSRSGPGYAEPARWLPEADSALREAIAMTIDGSIYVFRNDGALLKFTRGAREEFGLDPIEPPLSAGTSVITGSDLTNLYLLDAKERRLIVFTKEGKLLKQFTSPAFTELRDVAVDLQEEKVYVLNGNTIVEVSLKDG